MYTDIILVRERDKGPQHKSADVEVQTCSVTDQQGRACVWLRLAGLYFRVCTFRILWPLTTVGAAGFYEGLKTPSGP